jgi:hypothetical protein
MEKDHVAFLELVAKAKHDNGDDIETPDVVTMNRFLRARKAGPLRPISLSVSECR